MKKAFALCCVTLLVGMAEAFAGAVAEPRRSMDSAWEKHPVKGRDFWYLLKEEWLTFPEFQQEPFVQEAGLLGVKWPLRTFNATPLRALLLREISLLDAEGQPLKRNLRLTPLEASTQIYRQEALVDGDAESACGVSGDVAIPAARYASVGVDIDLQLTPPANPRTLLLDYGDERNPDLGSVELWLDGAPARIVHAKALARDRRLAVALPERTVVSTVRLRVNSAPVKYVLGDFPEAIQPHLKTHPFTTHLMRPVPFGLSPANFDQQGAKKLLEKYGETHLGICFAEWDTQAFFQSWSPGNRFYRDLTSAFGAPPKTRQESEASLHRFWDWHRSIFFDHIWGMSGAVGFAPYGMEWGGLVSGVELTNHTSTIPHRTLLRITAGAARQYDRPFLAYLAYYLGKYAPNSQKPQPLPGSRQWEGGPGAGISPSFAERVLMTAYFMGVNYFGFESQPWGQAERRDGKVVLNDNGLALRRFYDWTRSADGERGEWYTPILLASDYMHGTMRRNGFVWGYHLTPEKGERMREHISRAIDGYDGLQSAWDVPPYSHNLHNSPLGDVFDEAFVNPPSGNLPRFDRYAIVILPDEAALPVSTITALENYVQCGGTLVINSVHCNLLPAHLLPAQLAGKWEEAEGMSLPAVRLGRQAKVLMKTATGKAFAVSRKYGLGQVIMTLPKHLLGSDPEQPVPYIGQLLHDLQAEVLPFQVDGDVQFLFSRLSGGRWKVALLNNKGVLKNPWESKTDVDPSFASKVTLRLPASGLSVSELYAQDKLDYSGNEVSLVVPPGGIRVIQVTIPEQDDQRKPQFIGQWKLDGSKEWTDGPSRTQYHDMKYAVTATGEKVYEATERNTQVMVEYNPGYPLERGSVVFRAAPNEEYKTSDRGGYPVSSRFFWVFYHQGNWGLKVFDSVVINGPPARHRRWSHIAVTWDQKVCRLFVDGTEYTGPGGIPIKTYIPIWNNTLQFGTYGRGRRTFGGWLSDVRLYAEPLAPETIREMCETERIIHGSEL
ncbi:MAG: LamG domain-containing protein [Victivallales bacterium]|nr:LamG domain-containing protein [Victivallales bacterium]